MKVRAALLGMVLVACVSGSPSTLTPLDAPATRVPASQSDQSGAPRPTVATTPQPTFSGPELADRIDEIALESHLHALQQIAEDAGGNRATGTAGFDASVEYVAGVLAAAGYRVETQRFDVGATTSVNLLAEAPGEADGVLIVGAHLDSVLAGPGVNDNGSGVATLLEIARAIHELPPPVRTVRFAFWAAEEGGPFGSAAYVAGLSRRERDDVVAYLNFDMLASPNAVAFVYDEVDAAAGSDLITAAFAAALAEAGVAWEPIDLQGDSDHGPFVAADIPTGGLFSGGIELVTDAQARRSGTAVAGQPADPCSHRACDTIDNVDLETLLRTARVIAEVVAVLAVRD